MTDDPELAAIREWDSGTSDTKALLDVYRHRRTLLRRLDDMQAERDIARAELIKAKQDYCTESSAWKDKRESLVAERDSALNQGLGFSTVMNEMRTEFAKVSARLDAMTAERDATVALARSLANQLEQTASRLISERDALRAQVERGIKVSDRKPANYGHRA